MPRVTTYKALYPFQADEADELTLVAGDLIDVTVVHDGEWGVGVSRRTQREGSFPWSYVTRLSSPQSPHRLELVRLTKPAFCQHCTDFIWGTGKQAYKCACCDFCCHKGCKFFVENNSALECVPVPKAQQAQLAASDVNFINTWTVDDVRLWMLAVKLGDYDQLFSDKGVDGPQLQKLSRQSLQAMGVEDTEHLDMFEACVNELVRSDSKMMDGDFARRCAELPKKKDKDIIRDTDLSCFAAPSDVKHVHVVKSHEFKLKSFMNATWCDSCRKYLWGFYRQGLQCTVCGYNTHRMCLDVVPQCQPQTLAISPLNPVPLGMQPGNLFGAWLETQMSPGGKPPKVVVALIAGVENKGLKLAGLYSVIPNSAKLRAAREACLQKPESKTLGSQDPHAVAWLLKRYFSELPVPLIPSELYQAVIQACSLPTPLAKAAQLDEIVDRLPPANQTVLSILLAHLGKVAVKQKSAMPLAAAWASVLLRPPDEDIDKMLGHAPLQALAINLLITKCKCGGIPNVPDDTPPPIVPRNKKPSASGSGHSMVVAQQPQSYENVTVGPSKPVPAPRPKPPPRPTGSHGAVSTSSSTGLESYAWYAGEMERSGADAALSNTPDGTFLIRKSKSHSGFSLSVKYREIRHVLILNSRNKFGFSEPTTFDSLADLISHFEKVSLACYNAELETRLSYPFKTAPKNILSLPDETGYEEPDEEVYMSNREALRKSLERQAQDFRHTDYYSLRVKDLQRKLKAQEVVCTMLREQKKLHESYHETLSDADRQAVISNYAVLQKRLKDADNECQTIVRELAEETRKEREAEERHNTLSGGLGATSSTWVAPSEGPVFSEETSLYYVGLTPRNKAEKMLEGLPDGTFLVRRSARDDDPYTLSLRFTNETKHIQIKSSLNRSNQLCFGLADPPPFKSLDELCSYYQNEKLSTTISIPLLRPIKHFNRK